MKLTASKLIADTVRMEMRRRGWKPADLASRCGVKPKSLVVEMSAGLPHRVLRWSIEAAFDYRIDLGSGPAMLRYRELFKGAQGCDPYLLENVELRALCESLSVRDWRGAGDKEKLLDRLFSHVAANPRLLKKT